MGSLKGRIGAPHWIIQEIPVVTTTALLAAVFGLCQFVLHLGGYGNLSSKYCSVLLAVAAGVSKYPVCADLARAMAIFIQSSFRCNSWSSLGLSSVGAGVVMFRSVTKCNAAESKKLDKAEQQGEDDAAHEEHHYDQRDGPAADPVPKLCFFFVRHIMLVLFVFERHQTEPAVAVSNQDPLVVLEKVKAVVLQFSA